MRTHGTNSMYQLGCREFCCRVAHAAATQEWKRRGKPDPEEIGMAAKELVAHFGTYRAAAEAVGVNVSTIWKLANTERCYVRAYVARKVLNRHARMLRDVRLPIEPLLRLAEMEGYTIASLGRAMNARYGSLDGGRQVTRWKAAGSVSLDGADRLCVLLGTHLWFVYPELAEAV